ASRSCSSRQQQKHASLRSRPLIRPPLSRGQALRAPSPVNGRRASSFSSLPHRPERALLLRSGRRWRAAPDEGASAASCSCLFQATSKARFAALAPPHPPSGHLLPQAGEGLLHQVSAAASGPSPSPAQREKVARSAG